MTEPRPRLERYRDRVAQEEVASDLGLRPWLVLGVAALVAKHSFTELRNVPVALLALSIGALFFVGLRGAHEWTRRALVVFSALSLAAGIAELAGFGWSGVSRGEAAFHSVIALGMLSQFAGADARERFRRARMHAANKRRAEAVQPVESGSEG